MLTVLECINKSADFLSKKGIESARTNAELLLAHLLNCKRLDLYLKYDQPLNNEEIEQYREYLRRRGSVGINVRMQTKINVEQDGKQSRRAGKVRHRGEVRLRLQSHQGRRRR